MSEDLFSNFAWILGCFMRNPSVVIANAGFYGISYLPQGVGIWNGLINGFCLNCSVGRKKKEEREKQDDSQEEMSKCFKLISVKSVKVKECTLTLNII